MKRIVVAILLLFLCSIVVFSNEEKIPDTKEELGEKLFFEKGLSSDSSISCASCHNPLFAFADSVAFSNGVLGKKAKRNTPSAMNMAFREAYFFDGRATTLEQQALGPIQNPDEMNLAIDDAVQRLNASDYYLRTFKKLYAQLPNSENMCNAIASYERTLETGNSPFDVYMKGNSEAISESAIRGRELFIGKAKCFDCHKGIDFTTDEFKNIGLYNNQNLNDKGRGLISKNNADDGAFKIPGLRNVAVTAPYMHNGFFKTLKQVISYYNNPDAFIHASINRDTAIQPLHLSEDEQKDLVSFLESLTDIRFIKR